MKKASGSGTLFFKYRSYSKLLSHFGGPLSDRSSISKICSLRLFLTTRPPNYTTSEFRTSLTSSLFICDLGFLRRHDYTFGLGFRKLKALVEEFLKNFTILKMRQEKQELEAYLSMSETQI